MQSTPSRQAAQRSSTQTVQWVLTWYYWWQNYMLMVWLWIYNISIILIKICQIFLFSDLPPGKARPGYWKLSIFSVNIQTESSSLSKLRETARIRTRTRPVREVIPCQSSEIDVMKSFKVRSTNVPIFSLLTTGKEWHAMASSPGPDQDLWDFPQAEEEKP